VAVKVALPTPTLAARRGFVLPPVQILTDATPDGARRTSSWRLPKPAAAPGVAPRRHPMTTRQAAALPWAAPVRW
jgi:hypothetical protein